MMTPPDACFIFSKILILGQKMAQNDKKLSVSLRISRTVPHMIVVSGTHVYNDISSNCFHFLKTLIFRVFSGGGGMGLSKRAKNDP